MGLGAVVHESVATKDMLPLAGYLQAQHNVFQSSWGSVPWAVVGWGLRQIGLGSKGGNDKLPKGQYVLVDNIKQAAQAFEDHMAGRPSKVERVFTKAQFAKTFAGKLVEGQRLTSSDVDVLLTYMSRDANIVEYDGKIVKMPDANDKKGITDEDASVAQLKELTEKLKHQTDLLGSRVDELTIEIKAALARSNKVRALAALKAKKQAETSLTQRYATLAQLEQVAAKIEQASDNVALVQVMEASTGVLKTLNAQVGGVDRIDGVMDGLRDKISDTEELTAILSENVGQAVDDGEIEDELAALEQEARETKEAREAAKAQKDMDALPEVPKEKKESTQDLEKEIAAMSLS